MVPSDPAIRREEECDGTRWKSGGVEKTSRVPDIVHEAWVLNWLTSMLRGLVRMMSMDQCIAYTVLLLGRGGLIWKDIATGWS